MKVIGILIALSFFAMPVVAQNSGVGTLRFLSDTSGLTADEAVRFGIRNNGELKALRDEIEASKKRVSQSSERAPASVGVDGLQQTIGKSHRYTVKGTLPLELGNRRQSRVLTAQRRVEVKEWDLRNRETILAAEIRNKHAETVSAILQLRLVDEHLESLQKSYELTTQRVKEGKTAPLEKNMLLVEINRVKAKRENRDRAVRVKLVELDSVIGREETKPLILRREPDPLNDLRPLSTLTDRAVRGRPDLMLLRSMGDLADARIAATESKNKLDAAATLGYQRLRISETVKFNYLVFGITFKLPVGNKGKDEIEAAVLDRTAVEKRLAFGTLVVKQEVKKAVIRYQAAIRSREIYRNGVVSEAEKNLNVVRQMYELGRYSLLDFLSEQRRVIQLKQELVESNLEVRLAEIEVNTASNSPELVIK